MHVVEKEFMLVIKIILPFHSDEYPDDLLPLLTKFQVMKFLKLTLLLEVVYGSLVCWFYIRKHGANVFFNRLLVNLTQPAYLCFGNEYPSVVGQRKDPELMKCFFKVNSHLKLYKEVSIIIVCVYLPILFLLYRHLLIRK